MVLLYTGPPPDRDFKDFSAGLRAAQFFSTSSSVIVSNATGWLEEHERLADCALPEETTSAWSKASRDEGE